MTQPRTRVVIQSRLSSSRLPGKALMTVAGMPMIELVARRASRTGFEVVVATSVEPYDDRIAAHMKRVGIPVVRGNLDDVLGRFVQATADLRTGDRVVRLTGDNPVADAGLVQELIDAMDVSGHRYGRVDIDQVPEGLGAEVFLVEDLRAAAQQAIDPYDREHVTPWLRRELGELLFAPADNPGDPVAYRCTMDCLNDYDRISRLFDDEDDPVGVPWNHLVAKLKQQVDAWGPMAATVNRKGPRLTRLVLGLPRIGQAEEKPRDMSIVRDVFATAVNRGISHVTADASYTGIVRAGTVPALQQRMSTWVRLPALAHNAPPRHLICQVRASVERTFGDLGQRKAGGVLFSSIDDALAGGGAPWKRLLDYRTEGTVAEIGVTLTDPQDVGVLDQLPGLDVIVVSMPDGDRRFAAQAVADRIADFGAKGVTVLAGIGGADPVEIAEVLSWPWIDAVIIDVANADELDFALAAEGAGVR